jgi:hypothetical protein
MDPRINFAEWFFEKVSHYVTKAMLGYPQNRTFSLGEQFFSDEFPHGSKIASACPKCGDLAKEKTGEETTFACGSSVRRIYTDTFFVSYDEYEVTKACFSK